MENHTVPLVYQVMEGVREKRGDGDEREDEVEGDERRW